MSVILGVKQAPRRLGSLLAIFGLLAAAVLSRADATAFPVRASANGRYLVDSNGTPTPILGRAAWFVISLSAADRATFLDDTVARGFTAIEVTILTHDPRGNHPPYDGNGDLPFLRRLDGGTWGGALTYANIATDAPDFGTPNEAYWAFVDAFLADCEARGLLVLMFPAYVGYSGVSDEGWLPEMVANGTSRMSQYRVFIANRVKPRGNVVWMMGGDFGGYKGQQAQVESALISGLQSVAGQLSTQFSAEWDSGSICTDQATYGGSCTLEGAYSWQGDVATFGRNGYAHTPAMPAFLLEGPYDEEGPDGNGVNPNATQPVRRFAYWGWLSAIGGYFYGNGYTWPFDAGWQAHLDTQAARDVARLHALLRSLAWQGLVPSGLGGMKTLVTSGAGTGASYVAAAATPDGTLLLAYVPPTGTTQRTFSVDLTALSGPATARWWNPTTGNSTGIGGAFPNTGATSFTTPGDNGTGQNDWVLVLTVTAQTLTSVGVAPASATVSTGGSQQFTATALDQNGQPMATQPAFTWTVSGGGTIGASGLFTAGTAAGGPFTVTATGGGKSGTASVTVAVWQFALRVNSGGSASAPFSADQSFSGGNAYGTSHAIDTTGVATPAPAQVYQSERYGNFTYTFGGLSPGASYLVRLHFAEIFWTTTGSRLFDVALNGTRVLASFDVVAAAGAAYRATVREFTVAASASGQIVVQYTTVKDNAKSSGIELLSTSGAPPPPPAAVRVNSGGGASAPFSADQNFSGGNAYGTSHAIDTTGVATPAPAAVYQSERYGNFTYTFGGLTPGASYLVRLHFAEIYWTTTGSRLFDVALNGTRVLASFDVVAAAGAAYRATVREFTVAASASGQIVVQYTTVKDNAKSSGIELLPQ
jgi:hypothetical protein